MARFDDLYERFRKKRKEKGTGYSGAEPFSSARNAVTVTPETSDYTGTGRFAGILEKARKNGVSFSGVDENYIQSFMQDAQSFVKKSQQESQSLTWAGATSQEQYDNRVKTMQDLGTRADAVRVYLNANKGKINPEWYDYLSGFLRDFDSDTQSIFETFHGAKGYYSQWDSQEAYDSYETERAVYNEKSKADLSKLSVELENMKAQVEHARQIQAQIGAFNPYAYADSSSAIAAEKELKDKLAEITAQWGGMEGMEAAYSEKQQYYTTAKRIQDGKKLEEAANNEDFAAMSGYQSTELDNWLEKVFSESGLGYGDVTHEYINADPQKREELLLAYSKFAGEQTDLDKYLVFDNMSATEIGIYNYYYNKEGKEKAQEYLNHIAESLNYRMAEQYLSQYQGNALAEILLGIEVGAEQFQTGMKGLWNSVTGNEEYIPATTTQILGGFVREDLKDSGWNLPEWAGGASMGQMAYDLLSTTTNMVPSLAVSGVVGAINPTAGAAVGAGLLGASAAGNAYTEMINQGYSKQQARTYSALVGSSEAGLSYLLGGIGKLGGKLSGNVIGKIVSKVDNIFGKVAVKLGGTMLSEGMEEGLQEVLTPWFKQIATNIEQDVNWEEVAYSSLLGSLSGLLMEGPGAVQSARSETGGTGGTKSQETVKIDADWALETQPETRVEEVGLPLQNEAQAEAELKKQRFAVDLTRYSEKQRATVQAAMDSGVLNNTKKTHDFVDMVAKIAGEKGVAFQFADNKRLQELGYYLPDVTVNGVTTDKGIVLNMNSGKLLNRVVGHEITHVLEGSPELYNAMADSILELARTKGEYDSRMAQLTKLYEGREGYTGEDANAKIQKELVADLVGDYLFSDEGFVKKLSVENRNLFQKIWDEVKYLCRVVTAGSKEARQLATLEKRFAELYRAETKNPTGDGGVKYSLMAFEQDGRRFVEINQDQDRFDGHTVDEYPGIAKEIIKEKFENRVIGIDNKMFVNGAGRSEFAYPSKPITDASIYEAKMRASAELDNLLDAGQNHRNEQDGKDGHIHADAVGGFDYLDTLFKIGGRYFEARINIKNIARGKLFKDVTQIKDVTQAIMSSYGANPKSQFLRTSSMDSIRNSEGKVNRKNSLSEKVAEDIAPMPWEVRGEDVSLEGVDLPMPEDIARMEAGEGVQGAQKPGQEAQAPEGIGFPTREDVAQMEAREQPRSRVEEVGLPMPESREDQAAQSRERIQRAEEILGDKGSYMSKNATELYEELSGLKKGVKASSRLGYILDHGYEWRSVKTALLNIRDNPGEVVNPNSQAEALIREVLGREYDDTVEDLSRPDEVTNQYAEKLWNIKTEIANNQRLREEAMADYQEEIDRLQEMYDGKANKTTKAANDILRRIERVTRMKNTVDGDYTRRIERLQERVDKMDTDVYRRAQQRRSKQAQYESQMAELIGDTSTWKDKEIGISYWINTLRRNLRDVVRDKDGNRDIAKADAIYDELQGKYNHNEAELKRESEKIKEEYAKLNITKAEDAYIQMLGELRHNPSTELSLEVVEEFYEKHKKHIDKEKVDKVIEMARKTYDELLVRLNKRLREQGMKEIPYRKGYFPHFTEDKQGPLGKIFNWKTKNDDIPTDIAGLTEGFNPERSWQSFNKERTGDSTTYSFLQGMDNYVQGALDWIYHIEDIQKRRALENYIRYVHSEEGVKARIDEIRANEEYDADEAQQLIDMALAEYRNKLGNFVQDLRTGTNILAGKKNSLDRWAESATNRKIYSVMTNLSNRVSANQVAGSISSAMTNFIPITQSWGQVSPVSSLRAMLDTIRNAVSDDGTVNKSDFLTNRLRNPENLHKGTWDKISEKVGWLMESVDSFSSQTVWRSKYMENIAAGMSEAEAIKNADQFAENVLAGRSRGNMPTAFNAKNPIAKIATAFQLEVANQYGYILKDMPQDMKKETTGKLVKGYATMFLGAYVYNMAFSALTGRDAALDPIGIIEQLIRGLTDEEEEPKDAVTDFLENVLQEVPFVGSLLGGGRVPLSSAMPYDSIQGAVKGLTKDVASGDWKSVREEMTNPLYYLVSPMGGGQIRKTAQGLGMYFNEVPGSYTYDENGEPQLRFPVEEGIAPWLQAALFGKWSGQNAQQYLEEGRKPLSAKQTREFFESGMTIQEYWDYRDEMTKLKKQDEKLALINGMDITEDQKRVLKSYLFDEEKYAEENPEKYAFLEEEGIGYLGWKELPDDAQQAWSWAFKHQDEYRHYKENGVMPGDYTTYQVPMLEFKNEADQAYEWEYNYPDKAVMGDVFADGVVEYRKYIKAMSEMKSDKDADGKTVAGSRKQKVTDYINSLDIDYGEKIILYVTEFSSTASRDMYGSEIVEYLNGRNDLSEKQIREILKQLGFEVAEDGRVTWE